MRVQRGGRTSTHTQQLTRNACVRMWLHVYASPHCIKALEVVCLHHSSKLVFAMCGMCWSKCVRVRAGQQVEKASKSLSQQHKMVIIHGIHRSCEALLQSPAGPVSFCNHTPNSLTPVTGHVCHLRSSCRALKPGCTCSMKHAHIHTAHTEQKAQWARVQRV